MRKESYFMIFETHAHYDDGKFDQDREELLGAMKEHGIGSEGINIHMRCLPNI